MGGSVRSDDRRICLFSASRQIPEMLSTQLILELSLLAEFSAKKTPRKKKPPAMGVSPLFIGPWLDLDSVAHASLKQGVMKMNASESPHAPFLGLAKFTHENRGYSPAISITWCTKLGSKSAPIQPQVALVVLPLSTEAYPYGFSHFLFTTRSIFAWEFPKETDSEAITGISLPGRNRIANFSFPSRGFLLQDRVRLLGSKVFFLFSYRMATPLPEPKAHPDYMGLKDRIREKFSICHFRRPSMHPVLMLNNRNNLTNPLSGNNHRIGDSNQILLEIKGTPAGLWLSAHKWLLSPGQSSSIDRESIFFRLNGLVDVSTLKLIKSVFTITLRPGSVRIHQLHPEPGLKVAILLLQFTQKLPRMCFPKVLGIPSRNCYSLGTLY
ncbi:hypothetical protein VNO77_15216 [Canavalia gladiata]|uniref:Uncharacterized protein n=1 Tax=Canavalia gladiata TaxID=3824 RepID=A0AAN9QR43_CANGL